GLKNAEFVIAASVPVAASLGWSVGTIGVLGATIVVCHGIQQLFQLHAQWLAHRATYEMLKREESLYFAHAGPYRECDNPDVLLAERVEDLRARETNQWVEMELTTNKSNVSGRADPLMGESAQNQLKSLLARLPISFANRNRGK